ncbi:MAG: type VI secretion system protein ImpL, partial [Deferribacteres bacterium]|nr:type VI secretion system protein ImpL [Deferribacteres bacterium]
GLFFSSGRQEGTPYSHFLNTLGLISEKEVLPGTSRGLFLHDFFSKILPGDRGLFAPTSRAIQWQTFTRNLGLVSWVIIGVALCGLLSFSFVKNLQTLRGASHEFAKQPALQGRFMPDLVTMNLFNNAILKVEERNRDWWIPRFGLYESINAEKGLKENFSRRFREGFMAPLDRQMVQRLTDFTSATPDDVVARYVALLSRRINLLNARLNGEDEESIRAKPAPPYEALISAVEPDAGPDAMKKFGQLYLYYIIRRTDTGEIGKEIDIFQSWLKHLLALKGRNPRWIASWVDGSGSVPPMTLGDFWGGDSPPEGQEITVAPAFTLKGKEMIDSFIREIEDALPDPLIFADQKLEFRKWYRDSSFTAWREFSSSFSKGWERLGGREQWRNTAAKMAGDKGPYFAFLQRMTAELEPLAENGDLPPWLLQAYEFRKIRKIGSTVGGTIAKAAEKGKKVISALEKKLGRGERDASGGESLSIKAYTEYQKALNEITAVTASANQAYKTALEVFSEDAAVSKSPFYTGYRAASALKTGMAEGKLSAIVSDLVTGPLDFLWEYTLRETACRLQGQWESDVLAEIQGASRQQAIELLLGQNGYAWRFVKEPAAPFVRYRQGRGYQAREVFGRAVPFRTAFFTFLRKGAGAHADALARQNYNVLIRGLPTDANEDSRLKPHATHLELQCTDKTYRLDNYQFPVSRTFRWSPRRCGDVAFSIEVGDITLAKTYRGAQAFVDFLDEFKSGRRTFYPKEFPSKRRALADLGIRYIRVNYKFRGAGAVLKKFRFSPGEIVRSISHCWEQ